MARTPVWRSIAATLETEIAQSRYRPGDKLPTEAELAARFGVNRHTIRRALGDMADRGILRARRGSGVFVETQPTDYPIGRRVRFHKNIRATGRLPDKQVLRLETRTADAEECAALGLDPGAQVLVYEGLSLSQDTPIAHFESVFPAARFPGLAETFATFSSVTEALRRNGVDDFVRIETRINAERASATQALHLRLREGEPILRTVGINTDLAGRPVERGTTWFAGDRVTLTVASD